MGCLYSIESPSGKMYIGITSHTAEERFQSHWENTKGNVSLIHMALRKYGRENCELTTLVYSDYWDVLCDLEKDYIKHFNTKSPGGYNMTDGGDGSVGLKWNAEQRARRSDQLRGNKYATGCVHTEDGKRRMSALGRKQSEEAKRKMSDAILGHWAKPEYRYRAVSTQAFRRAKEQSIPFSYYDARFVAGDFDRLEKEFRTQYI